MERDLSRAPSGWLSTPTPPLPRVLDYQRTFGSLVNNDVRQSARRSHLRAASLCLMYWSVIESEHLLAGIAFDQDALHSRGIIKRPNRPQTTRSSVDTVQT